MKIIKKINNSAAIGIDVDGKEVVVLGKGIGFPEIPYELEDLSRIERTFYDVDSSHQGIIANIPDSIINVAAQVGDMVESETGVELNPNFAFTLADHLNFAVERLKSGIDLTVLISYDIQHLYQKEYAIGLKTLDMMKEQTGIRLPKLEAVNIALHLINAQKGTDSMNSVLRDAKLVSEVDEIISECLDVKIDKDNYEYSRYVKHLMYLVKRFENAECGEAKNAMMLRTLAKEYPKIYSCAFQVTKYFQDTWKWKCNEDETLYLMLHINRLVDSQ